MTGRTAPGRTLGPYRLEELLGEGATGVVFSARGDDGTRVAVKLLRPDRADEAATLARFTREALMTSRFAGRHLVPIIDVGEADGVRYLVLPYYAGGSLATRLRAVGRLDVADSVTLAAQLARGLDDLHAAGIVHRDVKPSNVLLDGEGGAALADFGLARAEDSTRLTREGDLVGTPHYLAPELIEGADATAASDVYALGCVLYECVTGAPPFAGVHVSEVAFAHLVEAPPDPRSRVPEVSAEVAEALTAPLEKDPSARPPTATAFARLLHAAHSAAPG